MPSKANDKTNGGQRGINNPPHADGGTVSRPSTATTADGDTPNALLADELLVLPHSLPPEQLANVMAAAAAATNASSVKKGAGDDARRLAPGLPRKGNLELANPGGNLSPVPSNSNRNENDVPAKRLSKDSPPKVRDAFVLDGMRLALPSIAQTGTPPPFASHFPHGQQKNNNEVTGGVAATGGSKDDVALVAMPRKEEKAFPSMDTNSGVDTTSELANSETNKGNGKNPPGSATGYDDGIFIQGGKEVDPGIDLNDGHNGTVNVNDANEGPPPIGKATAGSYPPADAAAACLPAPTNANSADMNATNEADATVGNEDPDAGVDILTNIATQMDLINYLPPPVPISTVVANMIDEDDLSKQAAMSTSAVTRPGARVELMEETSRPHQASTMLANSLGDADMISKMAAIQANSATPPGAERDLINYVDPPVPISTTVANLIDEDILSKRAALSPLDVAELDCRDEAQNMHHWPDEDYIVIPTREEIEDEDERFVDNRGYEESPPAIIGANADTANPDTHRAEDEEEHIEQINNPESTTMNASVDLETGSPYEVPLATWITDDVIEATPLDPVEPPLPWFKQKQAKRFIALFSVVLVAGIVAVVVPLRLTDSAESNAVTIMIASAITNAPSGSVVPSSFPTTTTFPSVEPTEAPSVSIIPTTSPSDDPTTGPSSPPSTCVTKMSSSVQKIDMLVNYPNDPRVAVDGRNMVVAVHDGYAGPVTVIFHSLTNDGWQRVRTFPHDDDMGSWPKVVISGKTAFVGFPYANDRAGAVLVYTQNQFDNWEEVEDPFIHNVNASGDRFGYEVGIHQDLASVSDEDHFYIFRCDSNKWVEIDRIDLVARVISISGDVITTHSWNSALGYVIHLYKYMPDLDGVVSIQDPISTGCIRSMDLSNNFLVYWDYKEEDAFIYRRDATNQTFIFHQQLNISGPSINYGLALDNDILVVGGYSNTYIFSEQNGNWEETITLDQRYERYAFSGRQLLATTENHDVHSYNIQDCAHEMPTQAPSLSSKPSASPTSTPSMSPSSLSPTGSCKNVTIAIVHDSYPTDTSWKLWRVFDDDGEDELFKSHQGLEGDVSHSQPICLSEGEWKFVIYDTFEDGLCCCYFEEGHYNVTSNGALIAEGGEFEFSETTTFSIPFVPAR